MSTFAVGEHAILVHSHCHPEMDGEVVQITGALEPRRICKEHTPYPTDIMFVPTYRISVRNAPYELAVEPNQLKKLPGDREPGSWEDVREATGWTPVKRPVPCE